MLFGALTPNSLAQKGGGAIIDRNPLQRQKN